MSGLLPGQVFGIDGSRQRKAGQIWHHFPDDRQKIIEYAIGGSALKHTIYGDFVRFTRDDVENLIAGSGNGRIQR